ncbi:MAG TPA: hypothetical protein VHY91_23505 [Pirellulales bacterium]|jgi:hypothetical protein|nr:hypothetical protein [Pirellulales bacterium]
MAKKSSHPRKPSGAASIDTIEDDLDRDGVDTHHETNGSESTAVASASRSKRPNKAKMEQSSDEHFGISDIKKGATFVNSIGGLDKAIAILQILKVAREVQ